MLQDCCVLWAVFPTFRALLLCAGVEGAVVVPRTSGAFLMGRKKSCRRQERLYGALHALGSYLWEILTFKIPKKTPKF